MIFELSTLWNKLDVLREGTESFQPLQISRVQRPFEQWSILLVLSGKSIQMSKDYRCLWKVQAGDHYFCTAWAVLAGSQYRKPDE